MDVQDILDAIVREAEEIDRIRQKIKLRSLIYQADRKDAVAKQLGLDPQSLYDLPYEQWAEIDQRARGADQGGSKA